MIKNQTQKVLASRIYIEERLRKSERGKKKSCWMTDGYFSSFFFERYFTGWLVPASEIYRWETEEVKRKKKESAPPAVGGAWVYNIHPLSLSLSFSVFLSSNKCWLRDIHLVDRNDIHQGNSSNNVSLGIEWLPKRLILYYHELCGKVFGK